MFGKKSLRLSEPFFSGYDLFIIKSKDPIKNKVKKKSESPAHRDTWLLVASEPHIIKKLTLLRTGGGGGQW